MSPLPGSLRLLQRLVAVRAGEVRALALAAGYFFFLLASWYVLRPLREAMGVAGGVRNLAWLFLGTLAATLAVQPLFAALVARWPRVRFIPWTYRFFAANLLLFFAALRLAPASGQVWIGRAFFVWTSVYTLFVVSVFWALMADLFTPDQGRRLFGFFAAGGTLGGLAGGALTALLAPRIDPVWLLPAAALLLEAGVQCVRRLGRAVRATAPAQAAVERAPVGGTALGGLTRIARSPYLAGIALFILLFTVGSTFLYFLQAQIAEAAFADRAARTAFFARIDVWVNTLTLALQTGLTGRLLPRLGVCGTLLLLPALSVAGFAALGLAPTLGLLVAFQVARRAGEFAVGRPARENLFIPLPREDKYKAKTFVDTFVYRAGDQVGAWAHAGLAAAGLGLAGISWAAVPPAIAWLALAAWLGRRHARLVASPSPPIHSEEVP